MKDSTNLKELIEAADALAKFFRAHNIKPAESLLVVAALHTAFMVTAQKEGKRATIGSYTQLYREGLELFADLHASLERINTNAH